MRPNYRYYIGIDCGVNTGMAIWDKQSKELHQVDCCSIIKAMAFISGFIPVDKSKVLIRIEDARLRKWIPRQKNEKAERGRNRGAGSVMRDAQIWEEFCTMHQIPFELVPPKDNKTKTTAAYFKTITGWQGTTNEHSRDAAMLVFGF